MSGKWHLSSRDKTITTLSILDVKGTSVKMTVDDKPMFDGARVFPYVMEDDVQQKVVMGSGADAIWVFLARAEAEGPTPPQPVPPSCGIYKAVTQPSSSGKTTAAATGVATFSQQVTAAGETMTRKPMKRFLYNAWAVAPITMAL